MRLSVLPRAVVGLMLLLSSMSVQASLTTDLQGLVSDLSLLNTELAGVTVASGGSCSQLGSLNTSIENYIDSMETVYGQLSTPLNLSVDDLSSLDDLTNLVKAMSSETLRLSWELRDIENIYDIFEYRAALTAMLRLSDDIGTMADRILEMADRILVMADNIGAMADRIIITQQLQNANVALTQAAILTTQQNMVAMSDSLSTIMYNLTLGQLSDDTQVLLNQMNAVVLDEFNMASQLASIETATTSVLTQTVNAYVWATQNSQIASHYINGDTLTLLGDLSVIHSALGTALQNYANAINTLSPVTDNLILSDATATMLRLTKDISMMSDRIMEMTDKIIVMSDNIGVMSDRIVETQNLQQTNIDLTVNSVLTAQNVTISVIQNMGL